MVQSASDGLMMNGSLREASDQPHMHKYHMSVTRTLEVTGLYLCSFMASINSALLECVPSRTKGSMVRCHCSCHYHLVICGSSVECTVYKQVFKIFMWSHYSLCLPLFMFLSTLSLLHTIFSKFSLLEVTGEKRLSDHSDFPFTNANKFILQCFFQSNCRLHTQTLLKKTCKMNVVVLSVF